MRALPIFSLVLVGCGGGQVTPDCVSSHGTQVFNTAQCESFYAFEDKILKSYAEFLEVSVDVLAEPLGRYSVTVRLDAFEGYWFDKDSQQNVEGLWSSGSVELGRDSWTRSAMAHEYVHLFEHEVIGLSGPDWGCSESETAWTAAHFTGVKSAADHCSWQRRGVWEAIGVVRR